MSGYFGEGSGATHDSEYFGPGWLAKTLARNKRDSERAKKLEQLKEILTIAEHNIPLKDQLDKLLEIYHLTK